ncbi:hypothetical protein JCM9533A_36410 [Catenuloplanes niger JCM 9533]
MTSRPALSYGSGVSVSAGAAWEAAVMHADCQRARSLRHQLARTAGRCPQKLTVCSHPARATSLRGI